jgi:hypothetical protein
MRNLQRAPALNVRKGMNLSREHKVRPKFFAIIFLVLGLLFLVGGLYTAGLWIPMFLACIPLLITKSDNVIGIIPTKVIQLSFFIALILGAVIHFYYGVGGAIGWYLTATLFLISFRVVRIGLVAVGCTVLSPFS